jgi:hypothetical protein
VTKESAENKKLAEGTEATEYALLLPFFCSLKTPQDCKVEEQLIQLYRKT